ncbi:MAG: transposase [Okeania sp. SIO3C4]|nr:transposase [Okeania sp. SIO3C4]
MMKNGKLAASIARIGFYQFRQRLTTKIVSSGGTVVLADQWFPSSKTCHSCGRINQELKLKDRTRELPSLWNENRPGLKCRTGVISVWRN